MAGQIVVAVNATTMTPGVADQFGHHRRVAGTFHFSTAYVAGGDTFTPQMFGLGLIEDLWCQPATIALGTTGYIFAPTITSEVTGGVVQILVTGNGNLAALGEIANGDYHTLVVRFNAWGV